MKRQSSRASDGRSNPMRQRPVEVGSSSKSLNNPEHHTREYSRYTGSLVTAFGGAHQARHVHSAHIHGLCRPEKLWVMGYSRFMGYLPYTKSGTPKSYVL